MTSDGLPEPIEIAGAGAPVKIPTNIPASLTALIREIEALAIPKEEPYPMAQENFDADVVVIGAGPGGYVSAIRAAQYGAKVICVEKEYLGGTCLNWGCIPSKAMIASVETLNHFKHSEAFGIKHEGTVEMDLAKFTARRDKIVQTLRGGVGMLFKKKGVEHAEGTAKFLDAHTIEVDNKGTKRTIRAKNFILATGSTVIVPPIPGMEGGAEAGIWTSDDVTAMPITEVPRRVLIIGGGVIGVEFGYVFNGLGSQVTIVEMMPNLISMMDEELGTELTKLMKKSGIAINTGTAVEKMTKTATGWKVQVNAAGKVSEIETDKVIVAVGRKAFTDNLGLEALGVKMHRRGVETDEHMQTSVSNIYAIGDVTGRVQLAHTSSYEGTVAVDNILKGPRKVDYRAIPNCIYTVPEVASVGLTEAEARAKGYDVEIGKYAFRGLGRAMAINSTDGFVKVVADKKYGEILGVHMIGHAVTDLIAQAVVAIKLEATVDVMIDTIHAHPTMSEALLDAYEDVHGMSIHKM